MVSQIAAEIYDDRISLRERRTAFERSRSPKASRIRRHKKTAPVPGMQQRRHKHLAW